MKKLTKLLLIVVSVLAIADSIYFTTKNHYEKKKSSTNNQLSTQKAGKSDNTPNPDSSAGKSIGGTTPAVTTNLAELKDVSLTVYLMSESYTSADGKTSFPSGSITPYFYPSSGIFSVQKIVKGDWVDAATNINYPGHGGLVVSNILPAEDNVEYRVIKIENGKATAVSKTFTVKRSDLAGGTKTYN